MLVAAGAVLFALFPRVYAASFSGFYLPFIVLLWLLMVRGMSIELRGHFESDLWHGFWDVAFCVSSSLLAFVLGVTIGNVLRGVPLDARGYFVGTFGFLLNGYALLAGVFALAALAMHGAAFAAWRVAPPLVESAHRVFERLWIASAVLFVAVTALTLRMHSVNANPAVWIAPLAAVAALISARFTRGAFGRFASSTVFLAALMACAAQTLYPYLLPAFPSGARGLTIFNSAPGGYSVSTAFFAALIGVGASLIYGTLAARRLLS
jgi:cytochrome d ubiquinol oxidase subunit II